MKVDYLSFIDFCQEVHITKTKNTSNMEVFLYSNYLKFREVNQQLVTLQCLIL